MACAGYDAHVTVNVLLADDEVIYSAGMAHVLRQQPETHVLPTVYTAAALDSALGELEASVVVMARRLATGLATMLDRAAQRNNRVVLLFSAQDEVKTSELARVKGALRRGDSPWELVRCVRLVAAGERCILPTRTDMHGSITAGRRVLEQLSPRQLQVVRETAAGAKNAEIARKIGTSEQVIKNMLREIYDMTGVSDRLELALFVLHHPELSKAALPPGRSDG